MPDNISCIIIEDEQPAAAILELFIAKTGLLQWKGTFSNAATALRYLTSNNTDLILLDINLPDISGISMLKAMTYRPGVIVTTAYPGYAVESFELEAVDYLLKPISYERFIKAVNRFLKLKKMEAAMIQTEQAIEEKAFVFIRCDKRMVKLFLDDILYLEAQKNYLLIYTSQETYRTYRSISDMEEKLPEHSFIRIHRSFIVATGKIEGYTREHIAINNTRIPIGRMYSVGILNILKQKPDIRNGL